MENNNNCYFFIDKDNTIALVQLTKNESDIVNWFFSNYADDEILTNKVTELIENFKKPLEIIVKERKR